MNADEAWALALSEWRRKFAIADEDPLLAIVELVRLAGRRPLEANELTLPPSFEEFRDTIELLDRRSKSFIQQGADILGELRRFAQSIEQLRQTRQLLHGSLVALGFVAGLLVARWL